MPTGAVARLTDRQERPIAREILLDDSGPTRVDEAVVRTVMRIHGIVVETKTVLNITARGDDAVDQDFQVGIIVTKQTTNRRHTDIDEICLSHQSRRTTCAST